MFSFTSGFWSEMACSSTGAKFSNSTESSETFDYAGQSTEEAQDIEMYRPPSQSAQNQKEGVAFPPNSCEPSALHLWLNCPSRLSQENWAIATPTNSGNKCCFVSAKPTSFAQSANSRIICNLYTVRWGEITGIDSSQSSQRTQERLTAAEGSHFWCRLKCVAVSPGNRQTVSPPLEFQNKQERYYNKTKKKEKVKKEKSIVVWKGPFKATQKVVQIK